MRCCLLALFAVVVAAAEDPTAVALRRVLPGRTTFAIPRTLWSPERVAELRANAAPDEIRAKADRWLAIPPDRWAELIPDRSAAPVSNEMEAGTGGYITAKKCIICGAVPGYQYEEYDLVNAPFTITTKCCHQTLHERAGDRPPEAQARIKGQDAFRHYDGEDRLLDYAESDAFTKKDGSPVHYYPANTVYRERLNLIIGYWRGGVLPDLTDAYLLTGDEKYAAPVVAILERLAEVVPHMPLAYHNGLAPENHAELIAAAEEHRPVGWHGWLGPSRLRAAESNFRPPNESYSIFMLAKAFQAVAASPAWGEGDAATARRENVREHLFRELSYVPSSYGAKQCVGNGIGLYAPGLLALGIVLQDRYFWDGFVQILEEFLYNENYYDGLSSEGSMNYAGMVGGMWALFDLAGLRDNAEYMAANPLLVRAGKSQQRLSTLRGVISQHGDGPNGAFMARPLAGNEPRRPSDAAPGYGISVLRGGGPGRQLEVIFSHDRIVGHAHDNVLGIQVHYQGVPILAQMGDSRLGRFIDLRPDKNPDAEAITALSYPKPMIVSDMERSTFSLALPNSPYTKNSLVIDEYGHQESGRIPWRGGWSKPDYPFANLVAWKGGEDRATPAADLQFAEAEAEHLLPHHLQEGRLFRRTLILVTRPDGRPYLLDIARAVAGDRQLMLYHSRGEEVATNIPQPTKTYPTLQDWLNTDYPDRHEWQPEVVDAVKDHDLLHNIRITPNVPNPWEYTWRLDYAAWAPKTGEDRLTPEQWEADGLLPVYLRLRGIVPPGERLTLTMRATSNLPASITETVNDNTHRGMVEFADAMQYVGTLRENRQGVVATHVHLLEAWAAYDGGAATGTAWLPVTGDGFRGGAVGLDLTFPDGSRDLIAYLPPGAGTVIFGDRLRVRGRLALVRLDPAGEVQGARLLGGDLLEYAGNNLLPTPAPIWRGTVTAVTGDLTGDRSQSVLTIRPTTPWPTGTVLAGRTVAVRLPGGRRTEDYVVGSVETVGDVQRVILANAPPFADLFGKVLDMAGDPKLPREPQGANSFIGTMTAKGGGFWTPYLNGSRLAFPRLGLSFTVSSGQPLVGAGARYDLADDVDLAALGVQPDDWFVLYPELVGAQVSVLTETIAP